LNTITCWSADIPRSVNVLPGLQLCRVPGVCLPRNMRLNSPAKWCCLMRRMICLTGSGRRWRRLSGLRHRCVPGCLPVWGCRRKRLMWLLMLMKRAGCVCRTR